MSYGDSPAEIEDARLMRERLTGIPEAVQEDWLNRPYMGISREGWLPTDMTVGRALSWVRKLKALETEAVQVIFLRNLIEKSVSAERESCALVAGALASQWDDEGAIQGACIVADAILARGKR